MGGRPLFDVCVVFVSACLVVLGLSSCGVLGSDAGQTTEKQNCTPLTVFAAASLTDAFEALGEEFERRNTGEEVRFSFAGSQVLLAQIQQGAPADIFAPADEDKMEAAVRDGLVSEPAVFARNEPVVIVPAGNPAGIEGVRDLASPGLDLVLAQDGVPINEYAEEILRNADTRYGADFERKVLENLVSREADVRAAANRVALGEADATFAYASDVTPEMREEVRVIEVSENINVVASYPIGSVEGSLRSELAREWIEFVLSDDGQQILEDWGFQRAG